MIHREKETSCIQFTNNHYDCSFSDNYKIYRSEYLRKKVRIILHPANNLTTARVDQNLIQELDSLAL